MKKKKTHAGQAFTAGQLYMEAQKSERPETDQDLLDTQKPAGKSYMDELYSEVEKGKVLFSSLPYFFVQVFTRQDKIMVMTLVSTWQTRETCPTPSFNQTVYRYVKVEDVLEIIWVLPSNERCLYYLQNPIGKDEGERFIIQCVHDLKDGTLEKIARELNKEEYQAGLAFVQDDNEGDIYVG
jgi:hypothetical protein